MVYLRSQSLILRNCEVKWMNQKLILKLDRNRKIQKDEQIKIRNLN